MAERSYARNAFVRDSILAKRNAEAERILTYLASMPAYAHTTAPRSVVRELLLKTDGVLLAQGVLHNIIAKHLAAGIYDVRLEPRK